MKSLKILKTYFFLILVLLIGSGCHSNLTAVKNAIKRHRIEALSKTVLKNMENGNFQGALRYQEKLLTLHRTHLKDMTDLYADPHFMLASCLSILVVIYMVLEQYADAMPLIEEILQIHDTYKLSKDPEENRIYERTLGQLELIKEKDLTAVEVLKEK